MAILSLKQIPNAITAIRLLLLVPISYFLIHNNLNNTFYFFIVAAISDGLDGWLARRYQWITFVGSVIDPLADKLLMLITYSGLAYNHYIPLWLWLLVILRDIWIVLGVVSFKLIVGSIEFEPTRISKLNTVFQLILVATILLNGTFHFIPNIFICILMGTVCITTISSFLDYAVIWVSRVLSFLRAKHYAVK